MPIQRDTILEIFGNQLSFCICTDIKKLNCKDSVKGILFLSANLKDFPIEVLRYKNLVAIDFHNWTWEQRYSDLNKSQKRKYTKAYNIRGNVPYIAYKPSTIKRVPEELKNLKNLKFLNIFSTVISDPEIQRVMTVFPELKLY
ncbi:MAG: hypothetical protein MUF75_08950 [Bacteroidia bacterium]|nr:hypothetical protein [Bacteroidia bacterium]